MHQFLIRRQIRNLLSFNGGGIYGSENGRFSHPVLRPPPPREGTVQMMFWVFHGHSLKIIFFEIKIYLLITFNIIYSRALKMINLVNLPTLGFIFN